MERRTEWLGRLRKRRRATKSVPGRGTMWSAYLCLLQTHGGEEVKDIETVPGE